MKFFLLSCSYSMASQGGKVRREEKGPSFCEPYPVAGFGSPTLVFLYCRFVAKAGCFFRRYLCCHLVLPTFILFSKVEMLYGPVRRCSQCRWLLRMSVTGNLYYCTFQKRSVYYKLAHPHVLHRRGCCKVGIQYALCNAVSSLLSSLEISECCCKTKFCRFGLTVAAIQF